MAISAKNIAVIVSQISYDFETFELQTFVNWVARQHGKPIEVCPYDILLPGLFGFWISRDEREIICYYNGLSPFISLITILHELGHIFLNHTSLFISDDLKDVLSLILREKQENINRYTLLKRDMFDGNTLTELEAEVWAHMVYYRIKRCQPLTWGNTFGVNDRNGDCYHE